MEFLRTPDPAASAAAAERTPTSTAGGAGANATGAGSGKPDRASIKSSFQQLFTPTLAGPTNAFLTPMPAGTGLTPFLGGSGSTPNLVTPALGMLPMTIPTPNPAPGTGGSGGSGVPYARGANAHPNALSSPFLQAAAKEAVRREFMNMPTYIAGAFTASQAHVVPVAVPGASSTSPQQQQLVYTKDGSAVPSDAVRASATEDGENSQNSEACVPVPVADGDRTSEKGDDDSSEAAAKVPESSGTGRANSSTGDGAGAAAATAVAPPFAGRAPYFAPPGMFLVPQMMPAPGGGQMYMPMPGMAGVPGMPGMMFPPGMMMMTPGAPMPGAAPLGPPKAETPEERKERIEREKQDFVREFKKKTREAALVRFRQKRRERKFGKHIRYECRKQLADARPRVKGRFVRIKPPTENDDNAQVVPQ